MRVSHRARPGGLTLGSLYKWAEDDDPGGGSSNGHGEATQIGATMASAHSTPAQDFTPSTLADVVRTFRHWLYVPDATPIYVNLATIVANRMAGDPAGC